jgi:hypothetical protein
MQQTADAGLRCWCWCTLLLTQAWPYQAAHCMLCIQENRVQLVLPWLIYGCQRSLAYCALCRRSPTLVLATRPRRSSRKGLLALHPAGAAAGTAGPEAKAAGAGAESGLGDDAAVKDSLATAAAAAAADLDSRTSSSLLQPLGQGVAAVTMPLRVSAQPCTSGHTFSTAAADKARLIMLAQSLAVLAQCGPVAYGCPRKAYDGPTKSDHTPSHLQHQGSIEEP